MTNNTNIASFSKFALPLIRASYPQLIAANLVSVQPMPGPTSKIFYQSMHFGRKPYAKFCELLDFLRPATDTKVHFKLMDDIEAARPMFEPEYAHVWLSHSQQYLIHFIDNDYTVYIAFDDVIMPEDSGSALEVTRRGDLVKRKKIIRRAIKKFCELI